MPTSLKGVRTSTVGNTPVAIGSYTAPSVTTGVVITGLLISNISVSSTPQVTCYIVSGGVNYYLCLGTSIIPGGNLILADEGNRIVLNSGDQVFLFSSVTTANTLSAVMSVAEIT